MGGQAIIYDAVRTPRGRGKATGSLHEVKPIDLTVGLLHALAERNPGLATERVDDIVMGIVSPVGDQGSVLPRIAALAATYCNARKVTIYGGSNEIQRNIISQMILGL